MTDAPPKFNTLQNPFFKPPEPKEEKLDLILGMLFAIGAPRMSERCNAKLVASDLLSDNAKAFWAARLSSKPSNNFNC